MGKAKKIEKRLIKRAIELNWDVDKLATSVIIDENLLSTDDLIFYKSKLNIKESVATYIINKFKPNFDPLGNEFNIGDYACEYVPHGDMLSFFKVTEQFKTVIDEEHYPNNRYKKITKAQFEYLKSEFVDIKR